MVVEKKGTTMNKTTPALSLIVALTLAFLVGCGSSNPDPPPPTPAPLSAGNINLIFVVSEDLMYRAPGDINLATANFTNQGLQRSLLMATYLRNQVLGSQNATAIYAVEPMTHLQTAFEYPDMVAFATMQQFAVLNQITLSAPGYPPYTGNSYPINVSYGSYVPDGVATPLLPCANCQGLDFSDHNGDNEALLGGIIDAKAPGFYVFSAPWETTSTLLHEHQPFKGLQSCHSGWLCRPECNLRDFHHPCGSCQPRHLR